MNLDNQSKYLIGQIISDKRDKTVTVRIDRKVKHPLYNKIITRSKNIMLMMNIINIKWVKWWL